MDLAKAPCARSPRIVRQWPWSLLERPACTSPIAARHCARPGLSASHTRRARGDARQCPHSHSNCAAADSANATSSPAHQPIQPLDKTVEQSRAKYPRARASTADKLCPRQQPMRCGARSTGMRNSGAEEQRTPSAPATDLCRTPASVQRTLRSRRLHATAAPGSRRNRSGGSLRRPRRPRDAAPALAYGVTRPRAAWRHCTEVACCTNAH